MVNLYFCSDRFRTAINVFGDSIGCAIVQHLSRKELNAIDDKQIIDAKNSDIKLETTYDNPTFRNQSEKYDNDNTVDRTSL